MPFLTVSGGLTLQVPLPGTTNYHTTFLAQCFQKIADHDHTGGGRGTQIGPSALAANAVTGSSLRLNNDQALRARNAANSADVDVIKLNTSDKIVLGANVTALTLDTALGVASGGSGLSSTPTNGQLLIGNGTNYTLAGLTGTSNQITVTNGSGTITLSTPQNLHTSAGVTFATVTGSTSVTTPLLLASAQMEVLPTGRLTLRGGSSAVLQLGWNATTKIEGSSNDLYPAVAAGVNLGTSTLYYNALNVQRVGFRGTHGSSTKSPTSDAPDEWFEVVNSAGTTRYIPAYAAS